jgi:competence protein ComEA
VITLTRKQVAMLVVPIFALLVLAGSRLSASGSANVQPSAKPLAVVDSGPTGDAPRLVVHVVGAVRHSGLFRVKEGARIADAIARAGGPTKRADLAAVNLAAPLVDGEQVLVPRRVVPGEAPPQGATPTAGQKVSLSSGTLEQFDELPGIGPVTAQKIIDWRATHALGSVDDLDAIPGIGPARVEQLRELVTP